MLGWIPLLTEPSPRGPRISRQSGVTLYAHPMLGGRRCTGVRYSVAGDVREARAGREVVVSAGTINSPQLLELSGIGHQTETAPTIVEGDALFADQPAGARHVMVAEVFADAGQRVAHLDAEIAQAFGLVRRARDRFISPPPIRAGRPRSTSISCHRRPMPS